MSQQKQYTSVAHLQQYQYIEIMLQYLTYKNMHNSTIFGEDLLRDAIKYSKDSYAHVHTWLS